MMDADEIVAALADTKEDDRVWIEAEGVEGWIRTVATAGYIEPEYDGYSWHEGDYHQSFRVEECELDVVLDDVWTASRTDGGDWDRSTVGFAEEWVDGVDGPEDVDIPSESTRGESREIESVTVVPDEMWEYREAALEESYSLRATSLRRVIYLDAACRYVASEEVGDVWWRYVAEVEEPSLTGFLEWLEVETLRQLWDEVGEEMFHGEDGVMDVEDRALSDSLSTLRYFHSS